MWLTLSLCFCQTLNSIPSVKLPCYAYLLFSPSSLCISIPNSYLHPVSLILCLSVCPTICLSVWLSLTLSSQALDSRVSGKVFSTFTLSQNPKALCANRTSVIITHVENWSPLLNGDNRYFRQTEMEARTPNYFIISGAGTTDSDEYIVDRVCSLLERSHKVSIFTTDQGFDLHWFLSGLMTGWGRSAWIETLICSGGKNTFIGSFPAVSGLHLLFIHP